MADSEVPYPDGGVSTAGLVRSLPPGQRAAGALPVQHYGPVPRYRPHTWHLAITGATAEARDVYFDTEQFAALPRVQVVADLHCVTRWSITGNRWEGVAARTLLDLVPPAPSVTHVMAWAEYGYSANLRLEHLAARDCLLATHRNGEPLPPQHGWPLRLVVPQLYAWKGPKWLRGLEYLAVDRRGFWEARGYHAVGEAAREQRYAHQE